MTVATVPCAVSVSSSAAAPRLACSSGGIYPDTLGTPLRLSPQAAPHIVYVRVDGFCAAVEQALRPRLFGRPVLVVHIARRLVVSASHEAKLQGVNAGMSIEQARALCPSATILPIRRSRNSDGDRYTEFSDRIQAILKSFSLAVDPDDQHGFYLNLFGSPYLSGDFAGTLRRLQLEILKQTGLNASIGAANSKIAAAVAARLANPGNLKIVAPGAERAFLAAQNVAVLHQLNGIDAVALHNRGISSIAELQRIPRPALTSTYGDLFGSELWQNSRGQDVAAPSRQPLINSWWNWLSSALDPALATS